MIRSYQILMKASVCVHLIVFPKLIISLLSEKQVSNINHKLRVILLYPGESFGLGMPRNC